MKKRTIVLFTCLLLMGPVLLMAGLVQHHTFDGMLNDAVGSNHGVMVGGDPNYVDSEIRQALRIFKGRCISLGTGGLPDPNHSPQGTIAMWFSSVNTVDETLVGVINDTSSTAFHITFNFNPRLLRVLLRDSAGQAYEVTVEAAGLRSGQWRHLAVVYQTGLETGIAIYIDGELQPRTVVANGHPRAFSQWVHPMYVGALNDKGAFSNDFNGSVDDLRVYDHALSALEVARLYTSVRPDDAVCALPPQLDLDGDCRVGLVELLAVAGDWLSCGLVPACIQ